MLGLFDDAARQLGAAGRPSRGRRPHGAPSCAKTNKRFHAACSIRKSSFIMLQRIKDHLFAISGSAEKPKQHQLLSCMPRLVT